MHLVRLARRLFRRRDEQGAVLVLATLGMVVAMVGSSLAIDLGMIAQEARRDQLVADMAALDAARVLPSNPTSTAQASAARNNFPYTEPGHSLLVEWGPTVSGPFSSLAANLPTATAVRVTAVSPHTNMFPFTKGPASVSRKAVSLIKPVAGFTIGSSLVNLDTSASALLNPLVGQAIDGTVNLSLVSWQGLATGKLTLSALQTQLTAMGFSVGTVSQLLSANMTVAQFYQAAASALNLQGDTANANILNTLRIAATSSVQMTVGGLIQVAQGAENAALSTNLNLFQLVTGSALLVNGTNTLAVSNAGITVPGLTSTAISLKVTELPQTYIGPIGGTVTTGQVELVVTPRLNLDLALGLSLLRVTGDLPVRLALAGATGTLTGATCTGITVHADPHAFAGTAQVTTLRVNTLGLLPILDVAMTSLTPSVDGPASTLAFSYPTEFHPTAGSKHVGSQPIGLQSLTTFTSGSVTVLNAALIPLGQTTSSIVGGVRDLLDDVIGNVDTNVLTPLLTALGLDVGGADVTALKDALQCTSPGLGG